jgi:hypothetical protein
MGLTKVFACRLFFQLPDFDTREKNSFSVWHSRQFFESGAQVTFLPDGVPSKKKKKKRESRRWLKSSLAESL